MDERITLGAIEVETSLGVTVAFDENLEFNGVQFPAGWTNPTIGSEEFDKEEVIEDSVLIGRKKGAKEEAKAILAENLSGDLQPSDIEELSSVDIEINLNLL